MDLKTLIETVSPTRMGWVLNTQSDFDLKASLEFSGQLIALTRACGISETIVIEPATVTMPMQA